MSPPAVPGGRSLLTASVPTAGRAKRKTSRLWRSDGTSTRHAAYPVAAADRGTVDSGSHDRPYHRSVLRGTVATMIANSWAMVLGIVTLPLLLGGLGADTFGIWVLLQTLSVTSGWLSLGDLGLSTSTVRFVAVEGAGGHHERAGRVAGTALLGFLALGTFWGGVVALVGPAVLPSLFSVPEDLEATVRTAVYWLALQVSADFVIQGVLAVLEGGQEVDRSRQLEMLRRTLVTGGSAVAAVAGLGLIGVSVAAVVGTIVTLVIAVWTLRSRSQVVLGRPERHSFRTLTRYGSSVALLRPLGVLHRTMNRLVVGIVLGPAAVTLVEIATQLQNGASAVLGASSYAVTPSAAWLEGRGDRERMRDLVVIGSRYTLLLTLPVVALTAMLAGPAVTVWVGPTYAEAVPLVVLAVVYVGVVAPLQVGSNMLVGVGRAGAVVRAAMAGLAINLSLSIALIEPFGVQGPFVATLFGAIALLPLLGRAVLHEVGLVPVDFVRSSVLPPLAATGVLGIAVLFPLALPLGPVITLVTGSLVGLAAYASAARRLAMDDGELAGLLRGLRRPTRAVS